LEGLGEDSCSSDDSSKSVAAGGRRSRDDVSRKILNQAILTTFLNSKAVLYMNSDTQYRVLYIQRSAKGASVRAYELTHESGVESSMTFGLHKMLDKVLGASKFDTDRKAWYVSISRLRQLFRISSLTRIAGGEKCLFLTVSRKVVENNAYIDQAETYRVNPKTGNFMTPVTGISNEAQPDPTLFFKYTSDREALERAKTGGKIAVGGDIQYKPSACGYFDKEDAKASKELTQQRKKIQAGVEKASQTLEKWKGCFPNEAFFLALRKKKKIAPQRTAPAPPSHTVSPWSAVLAGGRR